MANRGAMSLTSENSPIPYRRVFAKADISYERCIGCHKAVVSKAGSAAAKSLKSLVPGYCRKIERYHH